MRQLLPLVLAGALCTGEGALPWSTAAAQSGEEAGVSTDLAGAVEMARRALAIGRADVAVSIARQILAQAPGDPGAHMILAAALTRSGAPDQAVPVAKRGFRLAGSKEARFEGAYLTAEALAAAGRPWAAKLWLRRADLYAPTRDHEAVLSYAYRSVSAQSRLGIAVSLFGGPSDNVNGGSLHDTFWFYGIPIPITQAIPGQVYGVSTQLSYGLSPRTRAVLVWSHREVVLGDRARAMDPSARASDYRQDQLSLGLDHVWQDGKGRFAVLTSGSIGRRWNGGEVGADILRGSVELRRGLSEDWVVAGRLLLEAVDIPGDAVADSLTGRVSVSASHRADWLGALTAEAGTVRVESDAAGIAWRGPALALSWRPPVRSESFGLTVDLEAERRDYWRTPSFDADKWLSMAVTAELPSLEVMGFNPTVTLSAARTWSDVVVRDTEEIGISFGISSQF
ncbi:tetratricopeptide repeat protein [Rhodobacter sp. SGA-6-6]|uniref:tetratricopeptide repeat protein n=1 Tax=Rhodobacter sp. SGA-6-6 TaxID=2710882 RepID=UPI0013E9BFAA|nr:tetratricopeptide repeat protein [Rhodobacter sp. SGA-6-6]NGM46443.1 tetratricopeptide repeat protein [Rhodobacter sp. SGA-6-6]